MDVNGSRFHLLFGERDWASCRDDSAELVPEYDDAGKVLTAGVAWSSSTFEETLRPLQFRFVAAPNDRPVALDDRRGAARDRYGNWYWIDADAARICVKSQGSRTVSDFWPVSLPQHSRGGGFRPAGAPPPAAPQRFAGLAVTAHHYLLVGTLEPSGFLQFDLHAGGPPRSFEWPSGVPFTPFDFAAAPDGGVRVLDRVNRRYWILDRHMSVAGEGQLPTPAPGVRDEFRADGTAESPERFPSAFPAGVSLDAATPLPCVDPIAIEVTRSGSVLVLDRRPEGAAVFRFERGRAAGSPQTLLLDALDGAAEGRFLTAHDFAYVHSPENPASDALYVVGEEGNQAFAFDLSMEGGDLRIAATDRYLPMRLFQGKALVAAGGIAHYDHPGGFVPLVEQRRPLFARQGMLTTRCFDGREPGCVWHRLMIDGRIPAETSVDVFTRASDEVDDLLNDRVPFKAEPALYRRAAGSELPFLSRGATGNRDTHELLFQEARGRFLQVRLVLTGKGRSTPRLRALRAWYPRFSYLEHYLPAAYRDDPTSASFLERFLANPEGIFTSIEDGIAAAQSLLDVRSAPDEALEWLGSWFGVAMDPSWTEAQRRLFIRHAMEFFRYRGTVRGLRMALRLALEACADETIFTDTDDSRIAIRIVEQYRGRAQAAVVPRDVSVPPGIRFVPQGGRWTPARGREALIRRFRDALGTDAATFPLLPPEDPGAVSAWTRVCLEDLGFVPSSTAGDAPAWREFLAGRYRTIAELGQRYGLASGSLAEIPLPSELPADGAPLFDWYQFESLVQPMRRTAHRFRVLVPVPLELSTDAERAARLELARRIVELEKPAHTTFEVAFYYALFRVGEARLGFDSLVHLGGRAPELMGPFVLGERHLAEGYLAARSPMDARDRRVLGRDPLEA